MLLWLFVLIRVVSNPLSNVFQRILVRRGSGPLIILVWVHAVLSLIVVPFGICRVRDLGSGFWIPITIAALLAVGGNALIIRALGLSDLSMLGPVGAFKPALSMLPGIFLLGEIPSPAGLVGILVILAGSLFLADPVPEGPPRRLWADPGVQFRLAALVLTALEAVFLKQALRASSFLPTLGVWSILGFAFALAAALLGRGRSPLLQEGRLLFASWPAAFALPVTVGAMQACTLLAFQGLQVGYALALFQLSPVLSVFLGHRLFREPHLVRRLLASAVMAAGAGLIAARG